MAISPLQALVTSSLSMHSRKHIRFILLTCWFGSPSPSTEADRPSGEHPLFLWMIITCFSKTGTSCCVFVSKATMSNSGNVEIPSSCRDPEIIHNYCKNTAVRCWWLNEVTGPVFCCLGKVKYFVFSMFIFALTNFEWQTQISLLSECVDILNLLMSCYSCFVARKSIWEEATLLM